MQKQLQRARNQLNLVKFALSQAPALAQDGNFVAQLQSQLSGLEQELAEPSPPSPAVLGAPPTSAAGAPAPQSLPAAGSFAAGLAACAHVGARQAGAGAMEQDPDEDPLLQGPNIQIVVPAGPVLPPTLGQGQAGQQPHTTGATQEQILAELGRLPHS